MYSTNVRIISYIWVRGSGYVVTSNHTEIPVLVTARADTHARIWGNSMVHGYIRSCYTSKAVGSHYEAYY
jgi:hypothetical protein